MAVLTDFFDTLLDVIEQQCGLIVSIKELKAEGGIYAEMGDGFTDTTYYNKRTIKTIPVLFLCRHKSQKQCMEWLCSICDYLQRLKEYPRGNTFTWMDTTIAKEPNKIGRDEDGVYHYSCILNCKIHY